MSLLHVDAPLLDDAPGERSWTGEGRPRLADPVAGLLTGLPRPRPAAADAAVPAPRASAEGVTVLHTARSRSAVDDAAHAGEPAVRDQAVCEAVTEPAAEPADGPRRRTAGSRLADLALTLAAVLGLVVLGITVTAHVTGLRPLVVKSGSMEPTIPTGGMVLVRTVPASEIRVGDVVAVDRPDNTRVTHRVVAVEQQGRTAALTLKGDANEDVDPQPVVVDDAGRLVLSVPSIGRISAFLASAQGGFVLGCIVTAVALPVLQRRREPSP